MKSKNRLKVLHVDDDNGFLRFFQMAYKKSFDIESINSAPDALEKVKESKYDVIVTDFEMPEMDGLHFLKTIKKEFPFLPVIFYTNQGSDYNARQVFLAGASDYFTKDLFEVAHKEKLINSITNAHEKRKIEEELKKHQENLEELVKERTTQLEKANSELEKELIERKKNERDKALTAKILERLNNPAETDDIILDILRDLKEAMDYEAVAIRLKDGDTYPYFAFNGFSEEFIRLENCLCFEETASPDETDKDQQIVPICICGNIIEGNIDPDMSCYTRNGSFWTNNMKETLKSGSDFPYIIKNVCSRFGYNSIALIPLRSGKDIIGLMQINDSRPDLFTLERINYFEGLANSIGVSVARKQMEEALRKSEEFNKSIIRSSPDCIKVLDKDGKLEYMSPGGQNIMCVKNVSNILNMPYEDFFQDEEKEAALKAIKEAKKGGIGHMQGFCPTMDGTPKWWDVTIAPIMGPDGKSDKLLTVSRDITGQKKAEKELRKFKTLADKANYGIALYDIGGKIVYINKYFANIHGYEPNEVLNQHITVFHNEETLEKINSLKDELFKNDELNNQYVIHAHKNGKLFKMLMNIFLIKEEDGKPSFVVATALEMDSISPSNRDKCKNR